MGICVPDAACAFSKKQLSHYYQEMKELVVAVLPASRLRNGRIGYWLAPLKLKVRSCGTFEAKDGDLILLVMAKKRRAQEHWDIFARSRKSFERLIESASFPLGCRLATAGGMR